MAIMLLSEFKTFYVLLAISSLIPLTIPSNSLVVSIGFLGGFKLMTSNEIMLNQFINQSHGNNPCGKEVFNFPVGNIVIIFSKEYVTMLVLLL